MFYETVNTAECKNACIPAFSDRLPLGELRIITTTFASSFLAFSFISRDSETWAFGKWSVYFVIL